ncbi:MAG: hypothetical protein HFJ20_01310 [Clostridia bacterium]|nr:hypothetical protein [Clostridia bacterium]
MEKINPLNALLRILGGEGQNKADIPDLGEINEEPELIKLLEKARKNAEENAGKSFKDELYNKNHNLTKENTRKETSRIQQNARKNGDKQITINRE